MRVGNVDILPTAVHGRTTDDLITMFLETAQVERSRVEDNLAPDKLAELVRNKGSEVSTSLDSDDDRWKNVIPGRPIFNSFAREAQLGPARLKQMYLSEIERHNRATFKEIVQIFSAFSAAE
jgi:hypothetical protein